MKTIWLLSTLDRWCEYFPWDIYGYVETKEEADKWVSEARTAGYRKAEEVRHIAPNGEVTGSPKASPAE